MADTTYTPAVDLDGGEVIGFVGWLPASGWPGDHLQSSNGIYGGATITIATNFASGRDILLDPPQYLTMDWILASQGFTPGCTSPPPHTGGYRPADPNHSILNVWVTNNPDPEPFDIGHPWPSDVVNDALWVIQNYHWTTNLNDNEEMIAPIDLDILYPLYSHSSWQGQFQVIWSFISSNGPAFIEFWHSTAHPGQEDRLFADAYPFVKGLEGDVEAQSRKDRCPKCGRWDIRERFIEDGYHRGLLVCEECWDPEDPPTRPIPPDVPPIND